MPDSAVPAPGKGAQAAGWVLLILTCVTALVPFPSFFIWMPLAFVTFILAIVTLAMGRIGSGICMLLGVIIVPALCSVTGIALMTLLFGNTHHGIWESRNTWDTTSGIRDRPQHASPALSPVPDTAARNDLQTSHTVRAISDSPDRGPDVGSASGLLITTAAWAPTDTRAARHTIEAILQGPTPGTVLVPVIPPRITLHDSASRTFQWANTALDTFLVADSSVSRSFIHLSSGPPGIFPAEPHGTCIGQVGDHVLWGPGLNGHMEGLSAYDTWPTTPVILVNDLHTNAGIATITYPSLPSNVIDANAMNRKILTVSIIAPEQVLILWTATIETINGKMPHWFVDSYAAANGMHLSQHELSMGDVTGSQTPVLQAVSPKASLLIGTSSSGFHVIDLITQTASTLPRTPVEPIYAPDGIQFMWETSSAHRLNIVVAELSGAITARMRGTLQEIHELGPGQAGYTETAVRQSALPLTLSTLVWDAPPFDIRHMTPHFVICDQVSGTALGACTGERFLNAEVTATTIRVALAMKETTDVGIYEITRPLASEGAGSVAPVHP